MDRRIFCILVLFYMMIIVNQTSADVLLDAKVPNFTGVDLQGKQHRLSDYQGKIVVLEWSSPECPYSRRYYENGTLNSLYDFARRNDIVWINIVPRLQTLSEKQAFHNFDSSNKIVILDNTLEISTAYGASTTPQIFILNKQGVLSYSGAIDSSAILKTSATRVVPYTRNALDNLLAGQQVQKKITRVLGCYIKSKNELKSIQ